MSTGATFINVNACKAVSRKARFAITVEPTDSVATGGSAVTVVFFGFAFVEIFACFSIALKVFEPSLDGTTSTFK